MKVKELIESLKDYDENLDVLVSGYEGGVTKDFYVTKKNIIRDINKEWWYGESEIDNSSSEEAVLIMREEK